MLQQRHLAMAEQSRAEQRSAGERAASMWELTDMHGGWLTLKKAAFLTRCVCTEMSVQI